MGIHGQDSALEVVCADDPERAFDKLPVARLAGTQGEFGFLALLGDVNAGGDDEVDVAMRIVERVAVQAMRRMPPSRVRQCIS